MKNHMNLQLFAQPANHTGANGMSAEMKTYYEKRLLDQAEPLLVHDQFGDKYPIPANNGKTIEFRKYESLPKATEPLTEGVTPNAQALTVTPLTATVKQYGGWAAITDVLQLTAIDNNITQATKVLASQAGRTLDTVTREVLAGGTNVIYAPAGDAAVTSRANLTTASVLTPDLIDQAATALKAQNADAIGESYVAIVHPYVAYDLRRNPEWIDVHKYASPENIYNGEIGKLAGVRFIETSEAKIWTGTGCPTSLAVFGTLVLAAHAYAVTEVEGGGRYADDDHLIFPPVQLAGACCAGGFCFGGFMTAGEAIRMADELRPNNSFSDEMKQLWLRQADSGLRRNVVERSDTGSDFEGRGADILWEEGLEYDTPLLADNAAEALYPHWLAAQMDLALGETARAANELQLYTSYVQEFAAWVRRNYMPVGGGRLMT